MKASQRNQQKKLQFRIGGMTCVNCQYKIERQLKGTSGILSASVSYSKGTADIVYDGKKISPEEIITVIESLDYKVLTGKAQQSELDKIVSTLCIIVALYILLQQTGILNRLVPSQLADTKMGYGMLFVLGLITSVHCIAMCGGINLSQCIPRASLAGQTGEIGQNRQMGAEQRQMTVFFPALAYNLGRVLSYTVIGLVLGAIGYLLGGDTEVGLSTVLQGVLKIIAGILMVIMGMNMLGIFPWLRRFTIRMPKAVMYRIGKQKMGSRRPFIIGILNGFMPCGPLQSMWIVALATGNPLAGALSMFLFSLGTVPLMLGLGSLVSVLGKKFSDKIMNVGAILVVVLGLAMLSQGGALSGWLTTDRMFLVIVACCIAGVILSIPVKHRQMELVIKMAALAIVIVAFVFKGYQGTLIPDSSAADIQTEAEVDDGVQVVNSELVYGKYPNITVQAGIPVKWVIDAPEGSINGCNYRMIIRNYGIEYTFHTGENVIEFTPEEPGTVRYSCWMGMIHGNIFVTDEAEVAGSSDVAGNTVTDEIFESAGGNCCG